MGVNLVAALNFDEMYKKLTGDDLSKTPDIPVSSEIDKEISLFISKNTVSSEKDIAEYAKYLTLQNSGGNQAVENDLMEKIFIGVILKKMKKEKAG